VQERACRDARKPASIQKEILSRGIYIKCEKGD
jgi:hypothetical protein